MQQSMQKSGTVLRLRIGRLLDHVYHDTCCWKAMTKHSLWTLHCTNSIAKEKAADVPLQWTVRYIAVERCCKQRACSTPCLFWWNYYFWCSVALVCSRIVLLQLHGALRKFAGKGLAICSIAHNQTQLYLKYLKTKGKESTGGAAPQESAIQWAIIACLSRVCFHLCCIGSLEGLLLCLEAFLWSASAACHQCWKIIWCA